MKRILTLMLDRLTISPGKGSWWLDDEFVNQIVDSDMSAAPGAQLPLHNPSSVDNGNLMLGSGQYQLRPVKGSYPQPGLSWPAWILSNCDGITCQFSPVSFSLPNLSPK